MQRTSKMESAFGSVGLGQIVPSKGDLTQESTLRVRDISIYRERTHIYERIDRYIDRVNLLSSYFNNVLIACLPFCETHIYIYRKGTYV